VSLFRQWLAEDRKSGQPVEELEMMLQSASCELRNPPSFSWRLLVQETVGLVALVIVISSLV
jgi:hypothetical protein